MTDSIIRHTILVDDCSNNITPAGKFEILNNNALEPPVNRMGEGSHAYSWYYHCL